MVKAAVYVRISEDRSGLKLGVKRQEKDCRELAARKGWTVLRAYVDNDLSAFSGRQRPAYRELLKDIESGVVQAVVVWHLDRLHRHPRELEEFITLCDTKRVDLASVSGDIDLSTPDGRLMARIQGAVARKESEDKSRRIRRKHEELAEQGRFQGGGLRAYGYTSNRSAVVGHEAQAIREAVARILAGDTLRSIAVDFNRRGIRSARDCAWSNVTLRQVLLSSSIAGLRSHQGQVVAKAVWPAIIPENEWRRVRALLTDPARRTTPLQPVKHLLSGDFLRCGKCGQKLYATWVEPATKRLMYGCVLQKGDKGCWGTYIAASALDEFITHAVLVRLQRVTTTPGGRNGGTPQDDLAQAIADDQALLDELARALGERRMTMSEWLAARAPVEARIAEATEQVRTQASNAALAELPVAREELAKTWETLSVDRKRAVIRAVLDHAVISEATPGRKTFDPSRVHPVWRR
jgi:site-specific DNA recombinase